MSEGDKSAEMTFQNNPKHGDQSQHNQAAG